MTWYADTFDVGDRTVNNLHARGKQAWISKQVQKQLGKVAQAVATA